MILLVNGHECWVTTRRRRHRLKGIHMIAAAALPGSDAGSDVIKPASSFVIQNRQTACSMWCPMYGAHC